MPPPRIGRTPLNAYTQTDPPRVEMKGFKLTHLESGNKAANFSGIRRICGKQRLGPSNALRCASAWGTSPSAKARIHQWLRNHPSPKSASAAPIDQPSPTNRNQECERETKYAPARPISTAINVPATVVALPFRYPWQLFGHVLTGHRNGFYSASSLTRKPDFPA